MVISAVGASNSVYIDNIYFSIGSALSVERNEIKDLAVYPNPTTSKWVITTLSEKVKSVEVFDMLGKKVISLNPDSREVIIDASNLAKGMYVTKISSEEGVSTRKLVKN